MGSLRILARDGEEVRVTRGEGLVLATTGSVSDGDEVCDTVCAESEEEKAFF